MALSQEMQQMDALPFFFVLCDPDEPAFFPVSRSQPRLNDFAERHMVSGGRRFYYRRN
jgi:hypothetical protein